MRDSCSDVSLVSDSPGCGSPALPLCQRDPSKRQCSVAPLRLPRILVEGAQVWALKPLAVWYAHSLHSVNGTPWRIHKTPTAAVTTSLPRPLPSQRRWRAARSSVSRCHSSSPPLTPFLTPPLTPTAQVVPGALIDVLLSFALSTSHSISHSSSHSHVPGGARRSHRRLARRHLAAVGQRGR